jgi:predicted  nucleic acid-binding Zn-ribbon protein
MLKRQVTLLVIHAFSNQDTHPMTQKSSYIEAMKAQLDALNENMNTLQAKADEARDDVRDMYKTEMAKLQEQSKLAVAKLGEMKTASEESWDSMVAEMEKVRDAFVHSFHYFKSQV